MSKIDYKKEYKKFRNKEDEKNRVFVFFLSLILIGTFVLFSSYAGVTLFNILFEYQKDIKSFETIMSNTFFVISGGTACFTVLFMMLVLELESYIRKDNKRKLEEEMK